jgi:hypothetical protein
MSSFEETFTQAETVALDFLPERGFHRVERRVIDDGTNLTLATVRYRSTTDPVAGWSVTLSVAPYRLELSLDVADHAGHSYSVEELHRLEGEGPFPPREHDLDKAIRDAQALQLEFERLAAVLRKTGSRFFAGDMTLWQALAGQRAARLQDAADRQAIAASERAFQAKDWLGVIRWLEPLGDRLQRVSASRLAYARKRASET